MGERETCIPTPETDAELVAYIQSLVESEHDCGSACSAASTALLAAFAYVGHALRLTGAQRLVVTQELIRRLLGARVGIRFVILDELLYPESLTPGRLPTLRELLLVHRDVLAREAKRLLAEGKTADPKVRAHWEWLAKGQPEGEEAMPHPICYDCEYRKRQGGAG